MKKVSRDRLDFFVSDQAVYNHTRELAEGGYDAPPLDDLVDGLCSEYASNHSLNHEYKPIIDAYSGWQGLSGVAILAAHGGFSVDKKGKKIWTYVDGNHGEIEKKVQGWINQHDGKYAGLLLVVCNPGLIVPTVKKSVVMFASGIFNFGANVRGEYGTTSTFDMILPGFGEVCGYTVDTALSWVESRSTCGVENRSSAIQV